MVELIRGLGRRRPGEPRARPVRDRRRPGATRPRCRSSPRSSTCRSRSWACWPRPGLSLSARTEPRTWWRRRRRIRARSPGTSSATCRAARSGRCCRASATSKPSRATRRSTQLGRHGSPDTEVLVEVNVAGEAGKSGIAPSELPGFLERAPVQVVGLMTMPPLAAAPEAQPAPFRGAARARRPSTDLRELSMGTSQDYLRRGAGGRDDRATRHKPCTDPARHNHEQGNYAVSHAKLRIRDGLTRHLAPHPHVLRAGG